MTKTAQPGTPAKTGAQTPAMIVNPAYVIKVPKDDRILKEMEEREYHEFGFRDLDEVTYKMVRQTFAQDKELDAVRLFVANMWICGADKALVQNFRIAQAMIYAVLQIIEPWSADLKKN